MSQITSSQTTSSLAPVVSSGYEWAYADLFARFLQYQPLDYRLKTASAKFDVCVLLQRIVLNSAEGHTCMALTPAEKKLLLDQAGGAIGLVGEVSAEGVAPFAPILIEEDWAYVARLWWHEKKILHVLQAQQKTAANLLNGLPDVAEVAACIEDFLPQAQPTHKQRLAVATALRHRLTLIVGGPGTGKTTCVAKLLAILLRLSAHKNAAQALRIQLAAPTGKAAARMMEALKAAVARLPLSAEEVALFPQEALTLHRLLGLNSTQDTARYHAGRPLPVDVLVIDEGSMVDLAMFSHVLAALPDSARLIVLGDGHQLASIEAGAVLADLTQTQTWTAPYLKELAAWGIDGTGLAVVAEAEQTPLSNCVVLLQDSHRFSADSAVGKLAAAFKLGDGAAAKWLLTQGLTAEEGVALLPTLTIEQVLEKRAAYFEAVAAEASVATCFALFNDSMCLTSTVDMADKINQHLTQALARQRGVPILPLWYAGRPIMVTKNNYELGLFNGDIGIALYEAETENLRPTLKVAFLAAHGQVRYVNCERLLDCVSAYAMTIHKSQGSEFNHVFSYLSPDMSRAQLYTALTRAKKSCTFVGSTLDLNGAINKVSVRESGLARLLSGGKPND
jgi:exodeoxyribonuclease V alpha subunit